MNRYHDAMEHCAPPPELEARLREAVLSAEPMPQARPAVFRPKGFVRKALLAAVLAAVLTLSVGAAVLVHWDDIFSDRFGPAGAETPMAEKAFQPVNVSSVCDDVTVTIREALVSEQTVYLILDYQLPDTVDRELVESVEQNHEWQVNSIDLPNISLYLTGDVSWEDLKAADQDRWADIDWTEQPSARETVSESTLLEAERRSSGSMRIESQGYDSDTNTLTYLYSVTVRSTDLDFTAQPLTLAVTPPVLWIDGTPQAVTDHPALLTFQPSAVSQTLNGSLQRDDFYAQVTLSPFAISLKVGDLSGTLPYQSHGDLLRSISLVLRDGTIQSVSELVMGLGGGGNLGEDDRYTSLSLSSQFRELLDVSQVTAVRVGDVTIPLT